jgi:integrase
VSSAKITEAAELGADRAPRDLRHTFVSLMSADGVPIEEIARLAGHNRTATTELVYRHELRPIITTGAEAMDRILNMSGQQNRLQCPGRCQGLRRASPARAG